MTAVTNEIALTLVLLGMGLYFAVLTGRGLLAYVRFRRVRPTALLTWPCPRPPHLRLLLVLGAVSGFVTLLNANLGRPWPHVAAQLVMTFYFVVMVPLSLRVEWGLYADGVWADAGFLRYADVRQLSFRDAGPILLVLLPRHGAVPFRMLVPPSEYGAVRKLIAEKTRSQDLAPERLGL